ncbi:MAG: hypothetical protein CMJ83_20340 [Planctomycetes bacterium]|nr:hypothetical protein [Planctomycetota bacterium]
MPGRSLLALLALVATLAQLTAQSTLETGRPGFFPRQAGLRILVTGDAWACVVPATSEDPTATPARPQLTVHRTAKAWADLWRSRKLKPPRPLVVPSEMAIVLSQPPCLRPGIEILALEQRPDEILVHWHDDFPGNPKLKRVATGRVRSAMLVRIVPASDRPVHLGKHGRTAWLTHALEQSSFSDSVVDGLRPGANAADVAVSVRALLTHTDDLVARAGVDWARSRDARNGREVVNDLVALVKRSDVVLLGRVAYSLAAAARAGGPAVGGVSRLLQASDGMIRTQTVEALYSLRVPPATWATQISEGVVNGRFGRADARARELLKRGGAAAIRPLTRSLDSPDRHVRVRVCNVLGELGAASAGATSRLGTAAVRDVRLVRIAAMGALERIGSDRRGFGLARGAVGNQARTFQSVLRRNSIDRDSAISERAVIVAKNLLRSPDAKIRLAAFEVIAALVPRRPALYNALKPLERDADLRVRNRARTFFVR